MFFLEPIFQLIGFVFQIIFWGLIIIVGVGARSKTRDFFQPPRPS